MQKMLKKYFVELFLHLLWFRKKLCVGLEAKLQINIVLKLNKKFKKIYTFPKKSAIS